MSTTSPIGQPVRYLQEMLRDLSSFYPQIPAPTPDGRFGESTLEAVMVFQRDFYPPVTGIVDIATWRAIRALLRLHQSRPDGTTPLPPIPERVFPIQPGDQLPQLQLVQTMLDTLSTVLSGLEPTEHDGTLHGSTERNLRTLQKACGLPSTGALDAQTWHCLTRLYRIFVVPSTS